MDGDDIGCGCPFFNSHNEFFEEICSSRGAPDLGPRFMQDRYGPRAPRAGSCTHVQTAGARSPSSSSLNNIVRVAYSGDGGGAGCQSLHTDSMDETSACPPSRWSPVAPRSRSPRTRDRRDALPIRSAARGSSEELTDKMGGAFRTHRRDRPYGVTRTGKARDASGSNASVARRARGVPAAPLVWQSVNRRGSTADFRRHIAEASYRFSARNARRGPHHRRRQRLQRGPEIAHRHPADLARGRGHPVPGGLAEFVAPGPAMVKSAGPHLADLSRYDLVAAGRGSTSSTSCPHLVDGALANCTLGEMVQAMADAYGRYSGGPE